MVVLPVIFAGLLRQLGRGARQFVGRDIAVAVAVQDGEALIGGGQPFGLRDAEVEIGVGAADRLRFVDQAVLRGADDLFQVAAAIGHVLGGGVVIVVRDVLGLLDARIDAMLEADLMAEVRSLHERGYDWSLPSMHGLGYAQLGAFLRGEYPLEEAIRLFKAATHTFVRRQYTWFRKYLQLRWLDVPADAVAHQIVSEWLMAVGTR